MAIIISGEGGIINHNNGLCQGGGVVKGTVPLSKGLGLFTRLPLAGRRIQTRCSVILNLKFHCMKVTAAFTHKNELLAPVDTSCQPT